MNMHKLKNFTKMPNVPVKTLQRWDTEDTLKTYRNSKKN